mmetsp:Transcript_1481/g.2630  ORF Transcript_1481/g.2630 Transcript_1481/m.2630 type:complete len:402 (-) Transcript_1481:487-1692(-)
MNVVQVHIHLLLSQISPGEPLRVIGQLFHEGFYNGILLLLQKTGVSLHDLVLLGACNHEDVVRRGLVGNGLDGCTVVVRAIVAHADNRGDKGHARCDEVPSRFGDDANAAGGREHFVEHGGDGLCDFIEVHGLMLSFVLLGHTILARFFTLRVIFFVDFFVIIVPFPFFTDRWNVFQSSRLFRWKISLLSCGVPKCLSRIPQTVRLSRKSSPNIQNSHIKPIIPLGHFKKLLAIPQRHLIPRRIPTSTPHVKTHSHDIQPTTLRLGQQNGPMLRRCPKLTRKPALTPRIIRDNPHHQLYLLAHGRALAHLRDIIERHHAHAATHRIDHVSPRLGRVGVHDVRFDDFLRQGGADSLDQFDFGAGGAVEVASEAHEGAHDGGVGVAFDGVVGYDAGEGGAPAG